MRQAKVSSFELINFQKALFDNNCSRRFSVPFSGLSLFYFPVLHFYKKVTLIFWLYFLIKRKSNWETVGTTLLTQSTPFPVVCQDKTFRLAVNDRNPFGRLGKKQKLNFYE